MAVRQREGSPFWWYDFRIGGRRFRGSTGETTRQEALKAEAKARLDAESGALVDKGWKLRHLAGTYFTHVMRGKRSERTAEGQIARLIERLGKNTFVKDLTNPDIAKYIAVRRGEVSKSSVNREMELLRAMMNYAANSWDQPIPRINWRSHRLTEPPPRDRFLSGDEYETLLDRAHPDLRAAIIFSVATGVRLSNVMNMDWSQIDIEARKARFLVKGNKRHVVELRGDAFTVLAAMPHRAGTVFRRTNWRKRWESARKEAGLQDFRWHDLRHTFASWARINGADIADVKEALGHSDISMTMRYAHIKPGQKPSAFDLVLVTKKGTQGA